MYKKALCTCKVVVLRNKPIAFLTAWLLSPSSLLKRPNTSYRANKHKCILSLSSCIRVYKAVTEGLFAVT